MYKKRDGVKGGSSVSPEDVEVPKNEHQEHPEGDSRFGFVPYDMETEEGIGEQEDSFSWWKVLQPPKKLRLPLSIARVVMKNQKHREEKLLRENEEITRFGGYSSRGTNKVPERIRTEDRVLRSTEGYFKNGVLDVKHLLQPSAPRVRDSDGGHVSSSKGKKKKGGKKGRGKRKGGGKKKRH